MRFSEALRYGFQASCRKRGRVSSEDWPRQHEVVESSCHRTSAFAGGCVGGGLRRFGLAELEAAAAAVSRSPRTSSVRLGAASAGGQAEGPSTPTSHSVGRSKAGSQDDKAAAAAAALTTSSLPNTQLDAASSSHGGRSPPPAAPGTPAAPHPQQPLGQHPHSSSGALQGLQVQEMIPSAVLQLAAQWGDEACDFQAGQTGYEEEEEGSKGGAGFGHGWSQGGEPPAAAAAAANADAAAAAAVGEDDDDAAAAAAAVGAADEASEGGSSDFEDADEYGTTEEEEENNSIPTADLEAILAENARLWAQAHAHTHARGATHNASRKEGSGQQPQPQQQQALP